MIVRYLIDSSALWRMLRSASLHELWRPVVLEGDVRSCYPQRVEFLRSARNSEEFDQYMDMFESLYDEVAVPKHAGRWITALQRRAAEQGTHRALSAVDLQVCATAAHHGLTVLHDDRDYATAASVAADLVARNVHDGPLPEQEAELPQPR